MRVKANEHFTQDKNDAHFGQYSQTETMKLQIIRKGAEELDKDEGGEDINNQALSETLHKPMDMSEAMDVSRIAQGARCHHKIIDQTGQCPQQGKQHHKDQCDYNKIQELAIKT